MNRYIELVYEVGINLYLRRINNMNHTVLARKWRPKKFADLIGQNTVITVLNNIITKERLHHAYLLTGTRGVGKTTIARIIAKALNCMNLNGSEPCCTCQNCLDIDRGNFVDVIEIDAASNTGVDNIRELIDNAQYAPTSGKYKIYIIDEVHMLSKSAFNAMLKTLEEPPLHIVFILATTDPQKVPITILSRCLQLKLKNLSVEEINQHLAFILAQEKIKFEADALSIIAKAASGSVRDSLSILDQAIAFTNGNITTNAVMQMLGISDDSIIYQILDTLISLDSDSLVKIAKDIYNSGNDLEQVLLNLNNHLCNLSIMQLSTNHTPSPLDKYINHFSINDVQLYFEITNIGLNQIVSSNNKLQIFIMTLLRMIAFNIGSEQEKQIIIHQNNFKVDNSPTTIANTVNEPSKNLNNNFDNTLKPTIEKSITTQSNQSELQSTPTLSFDDDVLPPDNNESNFFNTTPIINKSVNFDGNWVGLIEALISQIDKSVIPFLMNATLDEYNDNLFSITIDSKYQNAFNPKIINSLENTFSQYFAKNIKFKLNFATAVTNTLKEKQLIAKDEKQKQAEMAIKNDPNLAQINSLFSATIVDSSITPIYEKETT